MNDTIEIIDSDDEEELVIRDESMANEDVNQIKIESNVESELYIVNNEEDIPLAVVDDEGTQIATSIQNNTTVDEQFDTRMDDSCVTCVNLLRHENGILFRICKLTLARRAKNSDVTFVDMILCTSVIWCNTCEFILVRSPINVITAPNVSHSHKISKAS